MAKYLITGGHDVKKWETAEKIYHLSSSCKWYRDTHGADSERDALIKFLTKDKSFVWDGDIFASDTETYQIEKFAADFMILRRVDDAFDKGKLYALTAQKTN